MFFIKHHYNHPEQVIDNGKVKCLYASPNISILTDTQPAFLLPMTDNILANNQTYSTNSASSEKEKWARIDASLRLNLASVKVKTRQISVNSRPALLNAFGIL